MSAQRSSGTGLSMPYRGPPRLSPPEIARALGAREPPRDDAFDGYLPGDLRALSFVHWTPLAVAVEAAGRLDELGARTVVDIGSGVGKFCVAAALAGQCSFVGLEQRPRLVRAARALAPLFEVENRVRFTEWVLGESDLPRADAYYLFNPFGENLLGPGDWVDEEVDHTDVRYLSDVAATEALFRRAATGTYVLLYNGFGGAIPDEYEEVRFDSDPPSLLQVWRKR